MDGITPMQRTELVRFVATEFGLSAAQLAEVSGFALARLVLDRLASGTGRLITIVTGPSQSSLPAFVAARRLLAWGERPLILTTSARASFPTELERAAAGFEASDGAVYEPGAPLPLASLWIDAIGPTSESVVELVETMNHARVPVVALDHPGGLDPVTGKAAVPAVRATATLALGQPFVGVVKPFAQPLVGELVVADLGLPAAAWRSVGLPAGPVFHGEPYLNLSAS